MIPKGIPIAAAPLERTSSSSRPMSNIELADLICHASPPLREARRRHEESVGTLVPHAFMGEVLARIGQCLAGTRGIVVGADRQDPEVEAILAILERGMASGSRETRNVIALSFANDGELEPFFATLAPLLGPKVRAQLRGK